VEQAGLQLGLKHTVRLCLERCIPLLIQQNVHGSFFNRSWEEFKVGFNDSRGNYWLGNELLHQLSSTGRYKLRFDLQARVNFRWYYAEYSSFQVESEQTNYILRVAGYSGNAGYDAFSHHNNLMFTTYDRDNDLQTTLAHPTRKNTNCAVDFGAGFWYNKCAKCRVNGISIPPFEFMWQRSSGGHLLLHRSLMWLTCR